MHPAIISITSILGFIAFIAGWVMLFGIPPAVKAKLKEMAMDEMGDNIGEAVTDKIDKLPEADQKKVDDVKDKLGGMMGGL